MSVSHKYRTFDQLLEDVSVDFSTYALEGMIEPQQLIKVATRVNYDLGLRIHRSNQTIIDIEHGKGQLPTDFAFLNYAFVCGDFTVSSQMPSGTHVDTTNPVPYVPEPGYTGPCDDPECGDVCVITACEGKADYQLIQYVGAGEVRSYTTFRPLRIQECLQATCDCPNVSLQANDIAEIKDGYLLTNFKTGKVYISYQGAMEDQNGNLLVLDHPYCNEYYEYALKQRILENMVFAGEQVQNQLGLIESRLRAARNNALSFVNTPDFKELQKVWEMNRKAMHYKYYDMFKSTPTLAQQWFNRI
ncbi:MAG: hypothetical protein CMH79_04360 [Nitrospinae bacterium]|nr:hypothetical protein [Nitrospinota bacterium]